MRSGQLRSKFVGHLLLQQSLAPAKHFGLALMFLFAFHRPMKSYPQSYCTRSEHEVQAHNNCAGTSLSPTFTVASQFGGTVCTSKIRQDSCRADHSNTAWLASITKSVPFIENTLLRHVRYSQSRTSHARPNVPRSMHGPSCRVCKQNECDGIAHHDTPSIVLKLLQCSAFKCRMPWIFTRESPIAIHLSFLSSI